jgi:hypothetical protein
VLLALAGSGAPLTIEASTPTPVRLNRVESAFSTVAPVTGKAALGPATRVQRGWLVTYSFEADFATTVRLAERTLKAQGWTRSDPDRKGLSAGFARDTRRLTLLRARTKVERCPRTGRTWQRTVWPRPASGSAGASPSRADADPASGWVTVECLLLEPQPSMARCIAPAKS